MFRHAFFAGILIVFAGLACLGLWVVSRLHHSVEVEAGHRAATLLEATLTPHAADFAAGTLPPGLWSRLDRHLRRVSRTLGILDMIIWDPGGKVLYAARPEIAGQVFPPTPHFRKAVAGGVGVAFQDEFHTDKSSEPPNSRFFEIYVPVRTAPDGPIVAVAEYYQDAGAASRVLADTRRQLWAGIFIIGILMLVLLHLVRRQGDSALMRARERQDSRLRQLNADIHDGIGQLLAVALLRIRPARGAPEGDAQAVRMILEEAMAEVQALLSGTSQACQDTTLAQAIRAMADDHARRTGTLVDLRLQDGVPDPPPPVKAALCRFVREGLHNALKHAGGRDQRVSLRAADGRLEVTVSDGGPGPDAAPDGLPGPRRPLGLAHLRHRIERLGGTLRPPAPDGPGTRLCVSFPLVHEVSDA